MRIPLPAVLTACFSNLFLATSAFRCDRLRASYPLCCTHLTLDCDDPSLILRAAGCDPLSVQDPQNGHCDHGHVPLCCKGYNIAPSVDGRTVPVYFATKCVYARA